MVTALLNVGSLRWLHHYWM